jgi:glycosyltransferase involved in cell wall biosynthesis
MNILIVSPRYPPSIGGIEYMVSRLAHYLVEYGFNVTIITTNAVDQRPFTRFGCMEESRCGRLRVLRFSCIGFITGYIPISPKLFLWCIRNMRKYDVVHVHGYGFITSDLVALLSSLFRKPVILTTHGISQEVLANYIYTSFSITNIIRKIFYIIYKKIILTFSLRVYSKIIVVSRGEIAMLPKSVISKTIYIHNGVDLEEFEVNDVCVREKYGVGGGECVVLYMGRLDRGKGVDFLLKTISKIRELSFKLVIVSPKSAYEYEVMKMIDELNIKDHVLLTGPKIGLEKLKLLKVADIVVVPSIYELFYPPELSVIEGVAAGKPIITVKTFKHIDTPVRNNLNGFLVKYNDIDGFMKALKTLIENKYLRERFSENSFKIAKKYSLIYTINKYIEVYHELLRNHSTPLTYI